MPSSGAVKNHQVLTAPENCLPGIRHFYAVPGGFTPVATVFGIRDRCRLHDEVMLKIIFDTRCCPLATMKDFGGCVSQIVYNIRTNNPTFSSFIASNRAKTAAEIEKLTDQISDL